MLDLKFVRENPKLVEEAVKSRNGSLDLTEFLELDKQRREITQQVEALKKEHINKVSLVAFCSNETGNVCWHELGWKERKDLNCYDYILNQDNQVIFNT